MSESFQGQTLGFGFVSHDSPYSYSRQMRGFRVSRNGDFLGIAKSLSALLESVASRPHDESRSRPEWSHLHAKSSINSPVSRLSQQWTVR